MMLGADHFAKRKTVKRSGDPAEGPAGSGNAVSGKGLHENHHRRDRKGGGHRTEFVLPCFSQQGGAAAGVGTADVQRAIRSGGTA